ncbi:MAG: 4Fe-4S binding protein [Duncaniella sp.]|nr:4Fe-4S binding protein [Duncaniella sp.]
MSTPRADFLRWSRIMAAVCVWTVATTGLLCYGGTLPAVAQWIGHVQFLPAAMAFSVSIIVIWLIVTLVFGRVYCSVACPLGIYQDICSRVPRLGRVSSSRHYHYSPALTVWRTVTLTLVVVAILLGITSVIVLADPWSIYTRACHDLGQPVVISLRSLWEVPAVRVASASAAGVACSAVTMLVITYMAVRNGRTFCNSICPIGTSLGYVSRYSIMHIDINTDLCTQCRRCEHVCKASCIDLVSHVVDGSRCVTCFDCLTVCPDDAIRYTWERHQLSIPMMQKIGPLTAPGTQCSGTEAANCVRDGINKHVKETKHSEI